ncbi:MULTISPECIES: response regulator transcription factor [Paenibacillus]|uniref:response regulator transcription factor n=1 Tax=Paenibacillus TaxID=44249 RepID=UPI00203E2A47|nr:response regulator transcription factor [Paenibacillus camelliae]MCM3633818.1 response regulator transcription factor [Paenibacillus camelliae]
MIRSILVVDDHPTVGYGTKSILERSFNCHVAYVMSGKQAIDAFQGQRFDIVVCDYMMPAMDGITLARKLKLIQPDIKIAMYSGYELDTHYNAMMEAGVQTILTKDCSVEDIETALSNLMRGYSFLPTPLLNKLRLPGFLAAVRDQELHEELKFDKEDIQLLQGIVDGYSNRELAQLHNRSQRAVEYHITKLYNKVNVRSRIQLMRFALMHQLVDESSFDQKQNVSG